MSLSRNSSSVDHIFPVLLSLLWKEKKKMVGLKLLCLTSIFSFTAEKAVETCVHRKMPSLISTNGLSFF